MPPRYPFARSQPSQPSQPSSSTPRRNDDTAAADQARVVSATGRTAQSPALGLTADSPNTLRSRIPSPRNPLAGFSNDAGSYPSPSQGRSRLLSLGKKKKKSIGGGTDGRGWMKVDSESPTKDTTPIKAGPGNTGGIQVPKYDARGYPARDPHTNIAGSSSSPSPSMRDITRSYSDPNAKGKGKKREQGLYVSLSPSSESLSSTLAGVEGESGQNDRDGNKRAAYPPIMSYSMAAPSYSPYDPASMYEPYTGNGQGAKTPSLYAESVRSHFSTQSADSMTHFKKFDVLDRDFKEMSISSKGGKRYLDEMFHLPDDPSSWSYAGPEPDDDFHDPDVESKRKTRFISVRGLLNIGCLVFLFILLFMLFAGYPVLTYYLTPGRYRTNGAYNLGGVNATGQIPNIGNFHQLIDSDTPQSAYTHTSLETGAVWELVFSDEFETSGRTFYDGDDPYWQAENLHYWATNNLEWYDPRMITTKGGSLVITLDNTPYNGLNYMGGMMTTWNRFCFTGGYVEASVSLPGKSDVYGLWPAIWSLGNLGRAGYGGTLDGLWPYSYDSCDVGTLPNQTLNGQPDISTYSGDPRFEGALSFLPGQRLSRCTCANDPTHPGPKNDDGTWKGRAAPEIDMIEATVSPDTLIGEVSLSGQWAPYNPYYEFINTSTQYYEIYEDPDQVWLNTYKGGVYQQASSALAVTDQNCYTAETGCFSIYGFEYEPGPSGYITWVANNKKAWTFRAAAMGPNADAGVGQRPVSEEPMYLIVNLGLSENFGAIDYAGLMSLWPVTMEVDYIRVYHPSKRNVGCDPDDMPTARYISLYSEAYTNPNITTFQQIPDSVLPKNNLVDTC